MNLEKGICVMQCGKGHRHGVIFLYQHDSYVELDAYIEDVSPGYHGFHVHNSGNVTCGADSLCDHYNPKGKTHGGLDEKESHAGDLGNLYANDERIINARIYCNKFTLSEVFGRSLILHQDEDDLGRGAFEDSLITGHSGKRILWGIIGRNDCKKEVKC